MRTRINFDASERVIKIIGDLQHATGKTKKEVLVSALLFLKWAVEERSAGRSIVAIDEDLPDSTKIYDSEFLLAAEQQ